VPANYTVDHEQFTARITPLAGFEQTGRNRKPASRWMMCFMIKHPHPAGTEEKHNRAGRVPDPSRTSAVRSWPPSRRRHLIERARKMWIPSRMVSTRSSGHRKCPRGAEDCPQNVCLGLRPYQSLDRLSHCVIENLRLGGMH